MTLSRWVKVLCRVQQYAGLASIGCLFLATICFLVDRSFAGWSLVLSSIPLLAIWSAAKIVAAQLLTSDQLQWIEDKQNFLK